MIAAFLLISSNRLPNRLFWYWRFA